MAEKRVKLKSSDKQIFEVDKEVAIELETIKDLIEVWGIDGTIPLPAVSGKTLTMVIEYCEYHVKNQKTSDEAGTPEDEIKAWDAEFMKTHQKSLFDLIQAANFLNIKNLLDLTCHTVADIIKDKSPVMLRKTFSIENDFTHEEEEKFRKQNQWAFE